MTAPNAAVRRGLMGTDGGVGTAPLEPDACADSVTERRTENRELRTLEPGTLEVRTMSTSRAPRRRPALDIQFLGLVGALHDEAEPRGRVLAHQLVDDAIGHEHVLFRHVDAQQPPRTRVQRRLPQHLRHHLAEPLEARDLRRAARVLAL